MTKAQAEAQKIFNSMKGFRVKYSHLKKCAINAVQLTIDNCCVEGNSINFYTEVLEELKKIQTP